MTYDVCLTPQLLPLHGDLRAHAVVVVDVLRATSVMVTALAHGVTRVHPVAELAECLALGQTLGCLMAAERDGRTPAGFDLGNSPFSYQTTAVRGRELATTTTNGTLAIQQALAQGAEVLAAGAFLNLTAVADWLRAHRRPVLVVCAGWKGAPNLEDTLFAGALAETLAGEVQISSDSGLMTKVLWDSVKADPLAFLQQSSHVQRLQGLDIRRDIAFCLEPDHYTVVPEWRNGALVPAA